MSDEENLPEHDPDNWIGPRSARSWQSDGSRSRRTPRPQTTTIPIVPHPSFFIFSSTNPWVWVWALQTCGYVLLALDTWFTNRVTETLCTLFLSSFCFWALSIFHSPSRLRRFCHWIVNLRHFDNFILFIILLSCIMQMLQNPKDLESDNNRVGFPVF